MSIRLAIFVSGRGSNMEAILKAISDKRLDAVVEVVLSNDPEARALTIARQYGTTALSVPNAGLTRKEHEANVLRALEDLHFDYIVLAGYMRILSPQFLSHFKDQRGFFRVINIHPSLLPAFPGKSAYEEAFAYGVKLSGVTVHLVDEKVDHGTILAQEAFPLLPEDTLESFRERGLAVEHRLYPAVLQEISKESIKLGHHSREPMQT